MKEMAAQPGSPFLFAFVCCVCSFIHATSRRPAYAGVFIVPRIRGVARYAGWVITIGGVLPA